MTQPNQRFEIDLQLNDGPYRIVLWDHGGNRQRFVVPLDELDNLIASLQAIRAHIMEHHEEGT